MTNKYKELSQKSGKTNSECVYLNACDCIYYGYGFRYLNKCDLTDEQALVIWRQAKNDLAKDF